MSYIYTFVYFIYIYIYILGIRVAKVGRSFVAIMNGTDCLFVKECPHWMDSGTRGCPVQEGVVLAGARRKDSETCFVIMELGYTKPPTEFYLPYTDNVHSIGMVYDKQTGLLTLAGGILYDKEDKKTSRSIREVWQIKLFEQRSSWYSLPDLPYDVFDPVLISHRGNLYVMGGYIEAKHATDSGNARKEFVELRMDQRDAKWTYMEPLKMPLDHDFGGRGILFFGNIIVFAKEHVQKYDIEHKNWKINYLGSNKVIDCTPVVDYEDRIIVSRRYTSATGEKKQDIAKYNFDSDTWACKEEFGRYPNPEFDIHHGAGWFLCVQLDPAYALVVKKSNGTVGPV